MGELASERPEHPFLVDGNRRWTYRQFRDEMVSTAKGFHQLGVRPGSKVGVLMGNRAEWILTVFATWVLGATAVCLNTWWKGRELRYALGTSDISHLVLVDSYLGNDYRTSLGNLEELRESEAPNLRSLVYVGAEEPNDTRFEDLRRIGETVNDETIVNLSSAVGSEDMAYLLFTSGSTAHPKAVPQLHGKLISASFEIGKRMGLSPRDRTIIPVSLFWSYGCVNALLATTTHGGTIVLQTHFSPGETLALIEVEQCSVIYATPNMGLALLQHPDRLKRDLSSLRTGIGRPASARIMYELGAKEVCTCYGLTESYANVTVSDHRLPADVRLQSSGTPLPGAEVEIVDPFTRAVLPSGSVGEVRLRGTVLPEYYKDPAQTANAFDGDGWFYTGDLGFLDEGSNLHIVGRIKEVIKTGGINVAPAEVEELLSSHPAVAQAVVVGIPDPERTEIIAALIVPTPGASVTEEELIKFCRANAAAYKAPRRIRLVTSNEVPLTDTGKVDKKGAEQLLANH